MRFCCTLAQNYARMFIAGIISTQLDDISHIFKKTVGISLWDYITSKRIETAMAFLSNKDDCNMLDIAVNCGFNNTANFNKAFRRVTGLTPTEFRRHKEYIG